MGGGRLSLCSHTNFLSTNIPVAPESNRNRAEADVQARDGIERSSIGRLREQETPFDKTYIEGVRTMLCFLSGCEGCRNVSFSLLLGLLDHDLRECLPFQELHRYVHFKSFPLSGQGALLASCCLKNPSSWVTPCHLSQMAGYGQRPWQTEQF